MLCVWWTVVDVVTVLSESTEGATESLLDVARVTPDELPGAPVADWTGNLIWRNFSGCAEGVSSSKLALPREHATTYASIA